MHKVNVRRSIRLLLSSGLSLLIVSGALGQDIGPSPSPSPSPTVTPSPSHAPSPKVVSVVGSLELDDIVGVNIENLDKWAETHDASKLVPYINGRAIKGNYPEELHISNGHVIFHLEITPENKDVWVDLLGEPSSIRRPVALSVGLENQSPFDSVHVRTNPITLTVISPIYGIIALVVVVVTLALFLWLARSTNILREPGVHQIGKRRPYSLGRAQMAFWFFLIYASYVTIWLITSTLDTITPSLLALMGISAGTALSEAMIDSSKDTAKTNQVQDLTAERQALEQSVSQTQSQLDAINAAGSTAAADQASRDALNQRLLEGRTRLGQLDQQLRTLVSQTPPDLSGGFLRDILSDSGGYSFHRFQIFAWTIVLGIIFISSVYNNLSMPEFSPTLLGLMGISAGTYIGFKFPEQQ